MPHPGAGRQAPYPHDVMKPRLSLVTLAVDDLERSVRFYRDGLGLPTEGIVGSEFEHGAVAFFDLQPGLRLALWPRRSLSHDSGLPVGQPGTTDFCLAHNVASKAEVDAVMNQAGAAGAVIAKPARDTFWGGYAGYFQDPDGHLWEVAWNPQALPDDDRAARAIGSDQPSRTTMPEEILKFWFEELSPKQWWGKDAAIDALIADRFADLLAAAARCELYEWRANPRGRLAEVIVLDQFPRHVHRDTPLSFACDPLALALAQEAVADGADDALAPVERVFLYLPYMHSESPKIQQVSVALYEKNGLPENLDFAIRHKAIVDRFGRYPHRNRILGRPSTDEEVAFLKEPGSGF